MSQGLIISVSGLRGLIGDSLTPKVAMDYGRAFGAFLYRQDARHGQALQVCMGRDSRPSGPSLAAAMTEGLCGVGIDVIDLGIVTTPGVGIMVRHLGCRGGVVITASHNPNPYNGIKLLLDNGMAPPIDKAEQIKSLFLDTPFLPPEVTYKGQRSASDQTHRVHVDKVLAVVNKTAIAQRKFRVVLDSVNGAGGYVGRMLLEALGCTVVAVNDEPTGDFSHAPEPTAQNLRGLCEVVKKEQAHIGFAQDPDADRLAIVTEEGIYIGEEYTLALAARQVLYKYQGNIATNLSTSRMIDDIAASTGTPVIRTPVGEAYVATAMLEHHCVIGGEGNGGVIDMRVGPIRDSLVAMAHVLQLMSDSHKSISQCARDVGGYIMHKDKFTAAPAQAQEILEKTKNRFSQARLNTQDGYRFDFEDAWLHLRCSNTEPVVRMIIEARDRAIINKYTDVVHEICKEVIG